MGYRSDVAILIYPDKDKEGVFKTLLDSKYSSIEVFSTSHKQIATESGKVETIAQLLSDWASATRTSKEFLILFNDVKWYSSYPDVDYWMGLVRDAEKIEGLSVEYAEVGEDTTDLALVQTGEGCEYRLSINRSIEVEPVPTPKMEAS